MKKDEPRHYHTDMRLSCPFYETDLKILWKKERNRLAAKKSRDRRAEHVKLLEERETIIERQLYEMKKIISDYDNILDQLITYLESNMHSNDLLILFSTLCNLKKSDGTGYISVIRTPLNMAVKNERIELLVQKIRCVLNDIVYKYED